MWSRGTQNFYGHLPGRREAGTGFRVVQVCIHKSVTYRRSMKPNTSSGAGFMVVVGCVQRKKEGFFFEKKNQKTF